MKKYTYIVVSNSDNSVQGYYKSPGDLEKCQLKRSVNKELEFPSYWFKAIRDTNCTFDYITDYGFKIECRIVSSIDKVKTESVKVSANEGFLFISLFNGDFGDGYTKDEIQIANEFLIENNYTSLISVSEIVDNEMICKFKVG